MILLSKLVRLSKQLTGVGDTAPQLTGVGDTTVQNSINCVSKLKNRFVISIIRINANLPVFYIRSDTL